MRINRLSNINALLTGFNFRPIISGITVLLCVSCAPIQVKFEYNKDINFETYKSYAWIKNEQPDIVDINFEKDVLDKVVIDAADTELKSRGYSLNTEKADFLVSYFLVVNTKTDVYAVENYYSNIGYATSPTTSSTRDFEKLKRNTYEQGILIIDFVDSQTRERIWRGYAQTRIGLYKEAVNQEKQITTAVTKILNEFPP
jgi:hypothetical protein